MRQNAIQDENQTGQRRDRVISIEYYTELSRPIGQCVVYDKDEIEQ